MVRIASSSFLVRLAALFALLACGTALAAEKLAAFDADATATSVSGISSGGYMAVQFHVAHSATVIGVGVLAAGPYYCAQGNAITAVNNCMSPSVIAPVPRVALLKTTTDTLAGAGLIDATANLKRAKVWLLTGKRDETVQASVVQALQAYYGEYVPASAIALVSNVEAGHAMVTDDYGGRCAATASPFINDCHFDAAGKLLEHIYGKLKPAVTKDSGRVVAFDQAEFVAGSPYDVSLADIGYAYVPKSCESMRCKVHVAFHGCKQSAEAVGEKFVRHAGYNRWADSNGIIVLYPQTISRSGFGLFSFTYILNPNGCWDWWGYTGPEYHTHNGAQVRAVKAMIDRLTQPR
jgi:poly(3-hydroxybutyrate) depolymerase